MKRKRSRYAPHKPPQQPWWSNLSEGEQIEAVLEHHRRAGVQAPSLQLHAATHVIVENQLLLGDETPVASTLDRLLTEGLSRHDAIHAIGSVLAPLMVEIMEGEIRSDPNLIYYSQLRDLSAESWLARSS